VGASNNYKGSTQARELCEAQQPRPNELLPNLDEAMKDGLPSQTSALPNGTATAERVRSLASRSLCR
jgi:hypothetical protein